MPWRLAPLVLAAVLITVALGYDESGSGAQLVATKAQGSLSLSNSHADQAILSAAGLGPGNSVKGTVTLHNRGSVTGTLKLSESDVQDAPGPGGGRLSDRLELLVEDTTGAAPEAIYQGPIAGLATRSVGKIGAGKSRRFRFTASFAHGTTAEAGGDNAYEGSTTSVRFDWRASGGGDERAPRLRLRVPTTQRVIPTRRLKVRARCDERCSLKATGTLRAGRKRYRISAKSRTLARDRWSTVTVRVPSGSLRAVRRSLGAGRRVRFDLVFSATDAAGNRARLKQRVTLVGAR